MINEKEILDWLDMFIQNTQNSLNKPADNNSDLIKDEITKSSKKFHYIPNVQSSLHERGDEKYIRIEKYNDYEFTHCIAYEMAIRNENVIKLTHLLENLNSLNYNIITSTPINILEDISKDILDFRKMIKDYSNISNDENYCILDIIKVYKRKINTHFIKNINSTNINTIIKSFDDIVANNNDFLLCILKESYEISILKDSNTIDYLDLSERFSDGTPEDKISLIEALLFSIASKLEKDYYVVNERKSITPENIEEYIPKDTNYEPNEAINNHTITALTNNDYYHNYSLCKGYNLYQGAYEDDNSFRINKVIPNFAQPLRMFNTMEISINPSLPLNDILSFVKKIKEDYDKKDSFKSFFELLNEELENEELDKKKANSIKFNKVKWADLFYIYDYYKFYKNKKKEDKKDKQEENYSISEQLSFQLTFYHNSLHNKNNPNNLKPIPEALSDGKLDFDNISYTKEHDFGNELYLSEEQIRKFYYKKISNLIEGENPEYKKLIAGRNHDKNSLIDGKNNASKDL